MCGGRSIFVEIILLLYVVNNKGFWLRIRSQLQVPTEPLKLNTKKHFTVQKAPCYVFNVLLLRKANEIPLLSEVNYLLCR